MSAQRKQLYDFLHGTLENNIKKITKHFLCLRETNHAHNRTLEAQLHCGIILAKSLGNHQEDILLVDELNNLINETKEVTAKSELNRKDIRENILLISRLRLLCIYSQKNNAVIETARKEVELFLETHTADTLANDTNVEGSNDKRTPSLILYEYLLLLLEISVIFRESDAYRSLHRFFHNFTRKMDFHEICKCHRIIGFLAALPSPYKDISKDIILQHLFRINYMQSALKNDCYRFLDQLYLNLYYDPDAIIHRFAETLLSKQVDEYHKDTRFLPLENVLQQTLQLTGVLQSYIKYIAVSTDQDHLFSEKQQFSWENSHAAAEILSGQLLPQESEAKQYSKTTFIADQIEPATLFIAADKNWSRKYQGRTRDHSKPFTLGAETVITSKTPTIIPEGQQFLLVKNTFSALLKLAKINRQNYSGKVIGITGSVGKTSTSTMLHDILTHFGNSYKNISFFNHQTGVPKSVANIPLKNDYSVIEMGMGRPLSILPKTMLVQPHIAIVVDIQHDHMEFHDSINSVIRTKMEIIEGLQPGGAVVLNRDSPHFPAMLGIASAKGLSNIITFGEHPLADIRATSISLFPDYSHIEINVFGKRLVYDFSLPGAHMVVNSLAVWAALYQLGVDLDKAANVFASLRPAKGRNEMFEIKLRDRGSVKVINDSFNANPSSMRSSFHILSLTQPKNNGKRVMIIGDMGELGPNSRRYHEDLAGDINKSKIDVVFSIGEFTQYLGAKIDTGIQHQHFTSAGDLRNSLVDIIEDGDVIAIKGSARGKEMENLIKHLKNRVAV